MSKINIKTPAQLALDKALENIKAKGEKPKKQPHFKNLKKKK